MVKKASVKRSRVKHVAHHAANSTGGSFLAGVLGLFLSYSFLSRALDTGSYWHYLGSVVFVVLGIKMVKRSLKNYGKKQSAKA